MFYLLHEVYFVLIRRNYATNIFSSEKNASVCPSIGKVKLFVQICYYICMIFFILHKLNHMDYKISKYLKEIGPTFQIYKSTFKG